MNVSPEPPERLAEILQEILALSDPTRRTNPNPSAVIEADYPRRTVSMKSRSGEMKKR